MKLLVGNLNYSSWSVRAWVALKICGAECEFEAVPLFEEGYKEKVFQHSPTGLVPCLVVGELSIWDSLAITEYLYEQPFGKQLYPADRKLRALARSCIAEMHSGFLNIRSTMPMNIRQVGRQIDLDNSLKQEVGRIEQIWKMCKTASGSKVGLLGEFGAVDAFFLPVVFRFQTFGVPVGSEAQEYMQSIQEHSIAKELKDIAEGEPWSIDFIDAKTAGGVGQP